MTASWQDNSDFSGVILSIAEAYVPGIVREFYEKYGIKAHIKIHQYVKQALTMLFSRKPQALIVGCGGAGRAAAVAAAELGFDTALMNRTGEKAQKMADEMPEYGFIVDQLSDFRAAVKECDLVIYTLPVALDDISCLTVEDFEGEDRYTCRVRERSSWRQTTRRLLSVTGHWSMQRAHNMFQASDGCCTRL